MCHMPEVMVQGELGVEGEMMGEITLQLKITQRLHFQCDAVIL